MADHCHQEERYKHWNATDIEQLVICHLLNKNVCEGCERNGEGDGQGSNQAGGVKTTKQPQQL